MTFSEIDDFHAESRALAKLVRPLDNAALETKTQFKDWRIADVLGHLAVWNEAACMTYQQPERFDQFMANVLVAMQGGDGMRAFEKGLFEGFSNAAIRERWLDSVEATHAMLAEADPKHRVAWGGPDMSIRSCVSARLMETWAHGQAVFDVLGVERASTDRLRSIVVLGINTFAFTFRVNGLTPPGELPRVVLQSPSGDAWDFGEASADSSISGTAEQFCQVVTQVRNIADTQLNVVGESATAWMKIAQCFAGPPNPPPPTGSRFVQSQH